MSLPTSPETQNTCRYGAVTSGPNETILWSLHESPREGDRLHPPGPGIGEDSTTASRCGSPRLLCMDNSHPCYAGPRKGMDKGVQRSHILAYMTWPSQPQGVCTVQDISNLTLSQSL